MKFRPKSKHAGAFAALPKRASGKYYEVLEVPMGHGDMMVMHGQDIHRVYEVCTIPDERRPKLTFCSTQSTLWEAVASRSPAGTWTRPRWPATRTRPTPPSRAPCPRARLLSGIPETEGGGGAGAVAGDVCVFFEKFLFLTGICAGLGAIYFAFFFLFFSFGTIMT